MLKVKTIINILTVILLINCVVSQIASDTIKCYQCTYGPSDTSCITDLSKIQPTDCVGECFTKINENGIVSRGCLPAADVNGCIEPNCFKCNSNVTDSACNNQTICKACDSSKNADCAQTDSTQDAFNAICQAADTKCVTTVNDSKNVERRCATTDDVTTCNSDTCTLCTGANCNIGIYPANRKRCYQCNTTANAKCSDVVTNKDDIKSKPCLLYAADDQCYMYATKSDDMTRGCVSDPSDNVCAKTDAGAKSECMSCGTDDCNYSTYERSQSLKCVQCNGTENPKCEWGQSADSAKDCVNKILYNANETCYTQVLNNEVYRGCYYDRNTTLLGECKEDDGCLVCGDSDGCNRKDTGVFSCARCRSDMDVDCRKNAEKMKDQCRNVVTEETSGCFWGTWNNVLIRGCLVDADETMKFVCNDKDNSQCKTCPEKDCNVEVSGVAMISANGLMVLLMAGLIAIKWSDQ